MHEREDDAEYHLRSLLSYFINDLDDYDCTDYPKGKWIGAISKRVFIEKAHLAFHLKNEKYKILVCFSVDDPLIAVGKSLKGIYEHGYFLITIDINWRSV